MFNSNYLRSPSSTKSKSGRRLFVISVLSLVTIFGCSDDNTQRYGQQVNPIASVDSEDISPGDLAYVVVPKYTYIRSYPGGGGIFPVRLMTHEKIAGDVDLSIRADPLLNARLDRDFLNGLYDIGEISIKPDLSIEPGTYEIEVHASSDDNTSNISRNSTVFLEVEVLQWGPGNIDEAATKRDDFVNWLGSNHPELGSFENRVWYSYMTYPQIWVVEHWTFLDKAWEFRLCYHVMIPPYDWSMIMLRRRGEWNPVLAARRETDGTIHEIPVSEYPIMYGY